MKPIFEQTELLQLRFLSRLNRRKFLSLASLSRLSVMSLNSCTNSATETPNPNADNTAIPSPSKQSSQQKQKSVTYRLADGVDLEMIYIPSGIFDMGSALCSKARIGSDCPQIKGVKIPEFYIGKYEVTVAQWQAIIGKKTRGGSMSFNDPSYLTGDLQIPVTVSWEATQLFCKKLSKNIKQEFRLPSEAEWEYACRAGTTTKYSFSDNKYLLHEYAWYSENSGGKTHSVGTLKPNDWGLYDMHGNANEWCQDTREEYGDTEYDNIRKKGDPVETINDKDIISSLYANHVSRGGSYMDKGDECSSTFRNIERRDNNNGFRLACVLP